MPALVPATALPHASGKAQASRKIARVRPIIVRPRSKCTALTHYPQRPLPSAHGRPTVVPEGCDDVSVREPDRGPAAGSGRDTELPPRDSHACAGPKPGVAHRDLEGVRSADDD